MKDICEGVFLLKLLAVFYQLQFYQRWTFLTKSIDQSLLDAYFYLLLSLKCFHRKSQFYSNYLIYLLFYGHLINPKIFYSGTISNIFDQSNEIHFASSCWALIIKGICNTLCSNGISLNVTLVSTACHWIVSRSIKNHLWREWGKGKYGNEVIFMLPSFSNNLRRGNYHI